MQPGRGAALLVVAVLLGIVLLNAADDAPPARVSTSAGDDSPAEVTTSTMVTTTVVTLPPRAPADVKVLTANGTDVRGVAGKAKDQLQAGGYNVLAPTDATKAATSAVYFVGDFLREAAVVAATLGLPPESVQPYPTPPPVPDARGASVVVVVGPELAQRLGSATTATTAPTAARTATTAAGATTTSRP